MAADNEYVLGTHDAELERLGLQHAVWRPRASATWREAGFTAGQSLLDVGCGPGYATLDLATIVGRSGRVIGVDRSRRFLDALEGAATARGLTQVEVVEADLDRDALPGDALDGAWIRWVFSFVSRPQALLARIAERLRPGGVVALHEYVDYRAWRLSPPQDAFEEFVREVMASWRDTGGEPDIGMALPGWLDALGFEIVVARPITEFARPADFLWQWPQAFVATGLQRLVDLGRVDVRRAAEMRDAFERTARTPGGFLLTPTVLELVARKR